jgi:hypothetical protein
MSRKGRNEETGEGTKSEWENVAKYMIPQSKKLNKQFPTFAGHKGAK